jgi:hypothetical protein
MKRNPHPARGSRIAALGVSSTAFVSIVTSFAWNTHQADLVANVVDTNVVPVQQATTDANGNLIPITSATTGGVNPQTPAATIAPTAPAAPAQNGSASVPAKTNTTTAPAAPKVAPATPVAPAAPTTAAVAPAAPAPTVVYTCMSPGPKHNTETPTASGECKNAKYGYVLTKI